MEIRHRRERGQVQNFIPLMLESGEQDKEESPNTQWSSEGREREEDKASKDRENNPSRREVQADLWQVPNR